MANKFDVASYFDVPLVQEGSSVITSQWRQLFLKLVTEAAQLPSANGIIAKKASETVVARTITAGSSKIDVTNGDGVSGNPTIDVDETAIDHDQLTNFLANEHIDWTSTTENLSTTGTVDTGDLGVTGNITVTGTADTGDLDVTGDMTVTGTAGTGDLGVTGNITVTGTVDGRDVAADGAFIDGINRSIATSNTEDSTTATIPFDDTIPQNTEGAEAITVSITPTSASNKLIIDFNCMVSCNAADTIIFSLFQDSTADALYATAETFTASGDVKNIRFRYEMTSGTTSSTTFKIRYGSTGNTAYLLSAAGTAKFGGVNIMSLSVEEYPV